MNSVGDDMILPNLGIADLCPLVKHTNEERIFTDFKSAALVEKEVSLSVFLTCTATSVVIKYNKEINTCNEYWLSNRCFFIFIQNSGIASNKFFVIL